MSNLIGLITEQNLVDYRERGTFGYRYEFMCNSCKRGFNEYATRLVSHQTLYEPAEYDCRCPHCGSDDCGVNDDTHIIKVLSRKVIHV